MISRATAAAQPRSQATLCGRISSNSVTAIAVPNCWTTIEAINTPSIDNRDRCDPNGAGATELTGDVDTERIDQCRKWRSPVNTMAMPCSLAAAITSASRIEPPG